MEVFKIHNTLCQPWFFPTSNDSISMCDPWESYDFFQIMANAIPDHLCQQCLPDCNVTLYKPTVVVQPFANCSAKNLANNRFCSFTNRKVEPLQLKFVGQMVSEFFDSDGNSTKSLPNYLTRMYTSYRTHKYTVFDHQSRKGYDAFDEDIAMVQIIYQKPTVVVMRSRQTMSWIDYFAAVGGLLGLVLGMGIISFFELFWLFCRIFYQFNILTE